MPSLQTSQSNEDDQVTFSLPAGANKKEAQQKKENEDKANKNKTEAEKKAEAEDEARIRRIAYQMANNFQTTDLNRAEPQPTAALANWLDEPYSGEFQSGEVKYSINLNDGKGAALFPKEIPSWEQEKAAFKKMIDHSGYKHWTVEFDWGSEDNILQFLVENRRKMIWDAIQIAAEKGNTLEFGPKAKAYIGRKFSKAEQDQVYATLRFLQLAQDSCDKIMTPFGALAAASKNIEKWHQAYAEKDAAIAAMKTNLEKAKTENTIPNVISSGLDDLQKESKDLAEKTSKMAARFETMRATMQDGKYGVPPLTDLAKGGLEKMGDYAPKVIANRKALLADAADNGKGYWQNYLDGSQKARDTLTEKLDMLEQFKSSITDPEKLKKIETEIANIQKDLATVSKSIETIKNTYPKVTRLTREQQAAIQQQQAAPAPRPGPGLGS